MYKTSFLGEDESFDMEKHQGPAWVDFVMRSLLVFSFPVDLIETDNLAGSRFIATLLCLMTKAIQKTGTSFTSGLLFSIAVC